MSRGRVGAIRYLGLSLVDIFSETYTQDKKTSVIITALRIRLFFDRMLKSDAVENSIKYSVVVLLSSVIVCWGICSMVGSENGIAKGSVSHVHGRMMGIIISAGRPMDLICTDENHKTPEIGMNCFAIPSPKKTIPMQIASGPMSCAIIISGAYKIILGMILYRIENH